MKFIKLEKVKDGKYLKNYELTYLNKAGRENKYEIVSRNELTDTSDLGGRANGVSIIVTMEDKMLLLHEFRMGINRRIYNLCAGMLEPGESIEECIHRELHEETGLQVKKIKKILPPSYSAVAISDTRTYIAFVEAEGTFADNTSDNEDIEKAFYTREQIAEMLETEEFRSRSQLAAYYFANGI